MDNDYDPSPFGGAPRSRKGERGLSIRPPSGFRPGTATGTGLTSLPGSSFSPAPASSGAPHWLFQPPANSPYGTSDHPAPVASPAPGQDSNAAPVIDTCGVSIDRFRHEQEHAWYNELYLLAPVGYFLVGLDGSILQVNLAGAELLGLSRAHCKSQHFRDFISTRFRADFERAMELAFNSLIPEKCMLELRSPDQQLRAVTLYASADGSGQACRVMVEPAEGGLSAMERNEERFRRIEHTAQEGIWEIDASARTTFVNPKMAGMLGYLIEEMLGQPLSAFMDEEGHALLERNVALRQQGIAERHEFRFLCKSGQSVWVSMATNPIFNSHGQYTGALALVTDIGERKQAIELQWHQTNFDTLTGLANRHMFMDRLAIDIKKADRRADFLALLLIDLDHFKEFNLRYGHAVGDALLVESARRIAVCVRSTDTLARLGGDEFAVSLSGLDHAGNAERIAQSIIGALSRQFDVGGQTITLSASVGIALYPPDASGPEALLMAAGQALAGSKNGGRNCYSYAQPDLQQAAMARQSMAADLRVAIVNEQFEVFYQPIITLGSGALHKAEALLRWHHPTRGMLAPAEFIPFAESSGQIIDIGDWVVRQVAQQARRWQRSIDPAFQISLNKSPVQFRRDAGGYLSALACIEEIKLPPNSVVIEVSEALLADSEGSAADRLRKYRAMTTLARACRRCRN